MGDPADDEEDADEEDADEEDADEEDADEEDADEERDDEERDDEEDADEEHEEHDGYFEGEGRGVGGREVVGREEEAVRRARQEDRCGGRQGCRP
ncbi:hypothetical protein ACFZCY_00500 [Streptomyces sp. NPDC007983]|uniref:hypothetical protein n=1 Tax=Streptomyces sp. NPDC007983 TaxID=3364800 RepID=UPI0036E95DB1